MFSTCKRYPHKSKVQQKTPSKRTTKITLPNGLTEIGDAVFEGCISLEELTKGLKYISNSMFAGCLNLKGKVIIPSSITDIGNNIFAYCRNLKVDILSSKDYKENVDNMDVLLSGERNVEEQ